MSSTLAARRTWPFARTFLAALMGATALVSTGAQAQTAPASQNATVNLIRALVGKGVLTQAEAEGMIAQAEAEAEQARAMAEAAQTATRNAQTAVAAASPASALPGTSVRYVPQFVRDEIKAELRQEVLADARTQGLVAPDAVPDWVRGITLSGDLRVRGEGRFYDAGNALNFVNVGAINNGEPYNTDPGSNPNNPPILNSGQDRTYLRLRARLGLEARIDDDLTAYIRIATGSDDSPVSTNQTLGGFFSKKDLWLDRAYVDFRPLEGAHLLLGRMANPFAAPELVWDEDVNLDGFAANYGGPIASAVSAFATVGVFPLDYVPDNFPETAFSSLKTSKEEDKWLFAGQVGGDFRPAEDVHLSAGVAYYDFGRVEGDLSPSCLNTAQYCATDYRRPGFAQKGNTLFALRDNFTLDPADQSSPQYYGLASEFRILAMSTALNWSLTDEVVLNLTGHYSVNLAYDESEIMARGFNPNSGISQIVNNNEECSVPLVGGLCPAGKSVFNSGDVAWLVRATIGHPKIVKAGDWSLTGSYRHIDPDALLDAFTDSDFRLGGTNTKGWTLGAAYGVRRNTALSVRWMNAEEISGPPLRIDLFQADLSTDF